MAIRTARYLTKYDITPGIFVVRKPAICRHFPVEQDDVVWSETETLDGECLVHVTADDEHHAVLLADPDFIDVTE